MSIKPDQIAERIEAEIHEHHGFAISKAMMYDIMPDDDDYKLSLYDSHGDIYQLINTAKEMGGYQQAVAFVTTGWATPVDDLPEHGSPSQSPNRRRVRLVLVCDGEQLVSVVRFEGEDTVLVENNGGGALPDKIKELFEGSQQ
jgi:hypothetical protein